MRLRYLITLIVEFFPSSLSFHKYVYVYYMTYIYYSLILLVLNNWCVLLWKHYAAHLSLISLSDI